MYVHLIQGRSLPVNRRNCVLNAFMQKKTQKGTVYLDEMPQYAASHQGLRYLPHARHIFGNDGQSLNLI